MWMTVEVMIVPVFESVIGFDSFPRQAGQIERGG